MKEQFLELQRCYMEMRVPPLLLQPPAAAAATATAASRGAEFQQSAMDVDALLPPSSACVRESPEVQHLLWPTRQQAAVGNAPEGVTVPQGLQNFSSVLSSATRYSRMTVTAEILRAWGGSRAPPASSILSSIEFDSDEALFATAGESRHE